MTRGPAGWTPRETRQPAQQTSHPAPASGHGAAKGDGRTQELEGRGAGALTLQSPAGRQAEGDGPHDGTASPTAPHKSHRRAAAAPALTPPGGARENGLRPPPPRRPFPAPLLPAPTRSRDAIGRQGSRVAEPELEGEVVAGWGSALLARNSDRTRGNGLQLR